ncbi:aspartate aminotransferase family protein [Pseudoalteromonas sp. S16_S37]|uniref:aspartate aminotransferase family protein n=1 Tax=Pseudoalteromonas sp. S16_S37 TaxID=2720228 RepID=UPI001681BE81|nr:aminotransferase class III-fold pyridoxal phosphate-dependent enzyme [Pseudoalteromonas sp. S16_S37]MBD1583974.1 aminotransferase class III-fold pyridoxal phosphate-dependent enzyme [Pseudoalteromonas sp. S16_S37]
MNNQPLSFTQSQQLQAQGEQVIAGFTQSMMKKPEQFSPGAFPVYLAKGEGAMVTDVDGNQYIDFICGLAANTLGHNHPVVVNAITENLSKGLIHSLPTPIEVQTAQTLVDVIPGAQMARFFKTGADANSAAVRLARHVTGRDEIMTVGYNGWHDQYMFDTPGVPAVIAQLTHRMPLFTPADEPKIIEKIAERKDELAVVLLSVPYNRVLEKAFLQQLRETCTEHGVILVFDEVVTGFRLAPGGAQEFFGVTADLVTLSKGIAAGMPLSAVAGKSDIMSRINELQVSTTFGGEMLSLEVCDAVLKEYQRTEFTKHIAKLGAILKAEVNQISEQLGTPLRVVGYDPIPMFLFAKKPEEHVKFAIPFLAQMAKRGILMRREVNFICGVHTQEHINETIAAVKASLIEMKEAGLFDAQDDE